MEHINRDENEQHNGQTHEEHLEGTLLPEDAGAPEEGHVDSGRLGRIKHQAKHTLDRAREGLSAGAATAAERGQQALGTVRERAGRTAEFVREAESDEQIRDAVTHRTETSLHRAGDALTKAAPSIGRGAEKAAEKLGQAIHAVSHPTGIALGTVAGTLGGWWKKAADEGMDLPQEHDSACRDHFNRIASPPPGMTYDRARPAYNLGFAASRNPEYRGRRYEELEQELRQGFGNSRQEEFDSMREFTRFGYEQGSTGTD